MEKAERVELRNLLKIWKRRGNGKNINTLFNFKQPSFSLINSFMRLSSQQRVLKTFPDPFFLFFILRRYKFLICKFKNSTVNLIHTPWLSSLWGWDSLTVGFFYIFRYIYSSPFYLATGYSKYLLVIGRMVF